MHAQAPQPDARIEAGDVLVLLGSEQDCAAAEMKLLQG
jgi:K+/H+ antiporter YhaU regulatory subunit KhtT